MPREISQARSDCEIPVLTRAMTRGNEASWSQFFDQYHRRLRAYLAACWKGEITVVDDLLQETLLRAVKHMRPFESEEALWSWLTVLARSAVADHGRKAGRLRRFLDSFRPEKSEPIPPDDILQHARRKLSAANQKLLSLKYDEGRTVNEIAEILQISEKAVESRLSRARATLKKIYQTQP